MSSMPKLAYMPEDEAWELEAEKAAFAPFQLFHDVDVRVVILSTYEECAQRLSPGSSHVRKLISKCLFVRRFVHSGDLVRFGNVWSEGIVDFIVFEDDECKKMLARLSFQELRATQIGLVNVKATLICSITEDSRDIQSNAVTCDSRQYKLDSKFNEYHRVELGEAMIKDEFERRDQLLADRTNLALSGLIDHLAVRDRDAAHRISQFVSAYITPKNPLVIHSHRERWTPQSKCGFVYM